MKALENIRAWRHLFLLATLLLRYILQFDEFFDARVLFLQNLSKKTRQITARTQKWKTIAAIIVYINIRMVLLAWSFFSEELAPPVQPFTESFSLFSPAPLLSVLPVTGFKSWLLFWSFSSTRKFIKEYWPQNR